MRFFYMDFWKRKCWKYWRWIKWHRHEMKSAQNCQLFYLRYDICPIFSLDFPRFIRKRQMKLPFSLVTGVVELAFNFICTSYPPVWMCVRQPNSGSDYRKWVAHICVHFDDCFHLPLSYRVYVLLAILGWNRNCSLYIYAVSQLRKEMSRVHCIWSWLNRFVNVPLVNQRQSTKCANV